VTAYNGVVWARADQPSCMIVEVSPTESFATSWHVPGPVATEATDYTARLDLLKLSPGQEVFYRVYFQDLDDPGVSSKPVAGYFRAAPALGCDVDFVWSGDTAGQWWGINPDLGGMRIYETMRSVRPDFFIHSGDTIYADNPIEATVEMPGGGTWRNVVTEEKSKVAETLQEFRGNHKYNLLDENVRRFNAEVPILAQWDDHETTNNWYPGEVLDDPSYTVKDVDLLAARSKQAAFVEFMPLRRQPSEDGRIYRVGQLRSVAGRLLPGHAHLPGTKHRQRPDRARPGYSHTRTPPGRVAPASPTRLRGDLESHRLGHAHRSCRPR
jgi:alkaline phosphatase D